MVSHWSFDAGVADEVGVAFNILSVLAFFGLVTAVFVAIRRGMGVHFGVILYERGERGVVEYNKVRLGPYQHSFFFRKWRRLLLNRMLLNRFRQYTSQQSSTTQP